MIHAYSLSSSYLMINLVYLVSSLLIWSASLEFICVGTCSSLKVLDHPKMVNCLAFLVIGAYKLVTSLSNVLSEHLILGVILREGPIFNLQVMFPVLLMKRGTIMHLYLSTRAKDTNLHKK